MSKSIQEILDEQRRTSKIYTASNYDIAMADPTYIANKSELTKQQFADPEARKNHSAIMTEVAQRPEYKAKQEASKIEKGKKISIAKTGRKHTQEARAKMSVSQKGKVIDPQIVKRIVATRKANGYTHSQETRDKMSAGQKGKNVGKTPRAKAIMTPVGIFVSLRKAAEYYLENKIGSRKTLRSIETWIGRNTTIDGSGFYYIKNK